MQLARPDLLTSRSLHPPACHPRAKNNPPSWPGPFRRSSVVGLEATSAGCIFRAGASISRRVACPLFNNNHPRTPEGSVRCSRLATGVGRVHSPPPGGGRLFAAASRERAARRCQEMRSRAPVNFDISPAQTARLAATNPRSTPLSPGFSHCGPRPTHDALIAHDLYLHPAAGVATHPPDDARHRVQLRRHHQRKPQRNMGQRFNLSPFTYAAAPQKRTRDEFAAVPLQIPLRLQSTSLSQSINIIPFEFSRLAYFGRSLNPHVSYFTAENTPRK